VLSAFVFLQCALHLVLRTRPLAKPSLASGMLMLGALAGSTAAVLLWPVPAVAIAALHDGHPGSRLAALWRQGIDFDGDGASPVLGGGDCNDFDASIYEG
jgi:hypothetical protein